MALESNLTCVTLEAGGDLSAGQFRFVELAADAQVDLVAAAGGDAVGVLQNDPSAAGRAATVAVLGVSKVVAGAAVAAGARVQSDDEGRALAAASGDVVLGRALTAASAAGEVIEVLLLSTHVTA
jgi:hypothetical protein